LWSGKFGNEYHARNRVDIAARADFWQSAIEFTSATSVLEVGCGPGWNLLAIQKVHPPMELYGVDINAGAVEEARQQGIEAQAGSALHLPAMYEAGSKDLVFTAGALIHIPPADLEQVMRGIVHVSARFVLAVEYHEQEGEVEVEYRGQKGALWRRNFGRLYQDMGLNLLSEGVAGGFDACQYYLLEKPEVVQ
jgi:pseudaminic acid biosynthesis-associated methylase